ncbi:energy-coupling factor ABC transporter ATP-binding protein [Pseudonocardia saturnea]
MTAVLEARGLCFAYERDNPVLAGADLALHAGRRVAVLGPNGGGKTTLFRLLAGALAPAAGEVLLDGAPVVRNRRGLTALRTQVQLVLQDPDDQLFSASVGQDVSFGPVNLGLSPDEVRARVDGALAALGITGLADRPTHMLSFGQKKRVAIAGAVAMAPRLLVLDEPTAGLDPAGVEELLVTLADLHATGTTPVLSTHDVDLAQRWADEVAVVADGRVVTGEASAILGDAALLRAARLGPAWAPAVHRLLADAGSAARPRTAAELHALLADVLAVAQATSPKPGSAGAPRG